MLEIERHGGSTPLDRILEFRNLPPEETRLAILRGIAEQIDAASQRGEIGGDLVPENIAISGDLGGTELTVSLKDTLSRFAPEEELSPGGSVPEAAHYLPPERILGTATDIRSHEFSLGVIAYQFVCGRKPFEAPDLTQLFYLVCTQKAAPAAESNRELSREVNAVFGRVLAKNREQRFPDCRAFVEALAVALRQPSHQPEAGPFSTVTAETLAVGPNPPSGPRANGFSTTRLRNRYSDEETAAPVDQSRARKFVYVAALCLALLGLALFIARYKPEPNLPVQVIDTNGAPETPPPKDQLEPAIKSPATAAPIRVKPAQRASHNPDTPVDSAVEFLTDPPAAQIVVDGHSATACAAPCTLSLPSGRHTLSASLSGYGPAQRIFSLPGDKSIFISLTMRMGTLVVTSVPSGSTLAVDGREYGVTPATLHLAPGQHRLVLTNGQRQHSDTVTVEADAIQAKAFNW